MTAGVPKPHRKTFAWRQTGRIVELDGRAKLPDDATYLITEGDAGWAKVESGIGLNSSRPALPPVAGGSPEGDKKRSKS